LIGGIEDLKGLRQPGVAVVRAQDAVAQSVKSADPHAAGVDRQHRRNAGEHFARGLVGEGHRQNALWPDLAGLDQPRDAGGEHPGLSRAGAGKNQRGLVRERDGFELLGIQTFENRHSATGGGGINAGLYKLTYRRDTESRRKPRIQSRRDSPAIGC
jgi:hypothetical protein